MPVSAPPGGFGSRVERAVDALAASAVAPSVRRELAAYCDLAVVWSQRLDLTAARSADELVDLLIADALAIAVARSLPAPAGPSRPERWLDVGSGVGAPGIPLALLLPVHMTLLEPREKRVAFLRSATGSLRRPDIAVNRARSDALPPACCEVAVSRATLPPPEWLNEGARLATNHVWLLLAKAALPELGTYRVLADVRYQWPLTGVERRAVCVAVGAGESTA